MAVLQPQHLEWLEARGISADLAEKFGLESVVRSFLEDEPGPSGEDVWTKAQAIALPYIEHGKVVNHKYRRIGKKQHAIDKGGVLCLWNHDCLLEESDKPVVIFEGEWDALLAISMGFRAVSVPNGTPDKASDDPANDRRYNYLWRARDALAKVGRFILATDGDKAGMVLRTDLIALLGPDRCSFVEYPMGVNRQLKDLTEVWEQCGPEEVSRALLDAKPVPVQGLYRMNDFPDVPALEGIPSGIDDLDEYFQIVLGTLTVITGYANMGKSTVFDTMMAKQIGENIPVCAASFETIPKPIFFDAIARALIGCSELDFYRHHQRQAAYDTLQKQLVVITNALDENLEFDIDTFLDTARVAVHRDGAKIVVIDPWNELEHKRGRDETLTEYIGRAIRKVKAFAKQHNVAFFIIAHPTKPQRGTKDMPSLYDISDSANWANKADYGLVYHRKNPAVNDAILAVVKVRKGLPGKRGNINVKFDHRLGRITGA